MPNLSIAKKYTYFRWLAADLALNTTNAPWLSNVLKIVTFTAPISAGANAQTAYTGGYNGLTPGGTLQKLTQGATFYLVSGVTGWVLPNAVEITIPTISSLNPLSVGPGDTLNITGINLLATKYVIVGGVSCAIDTASITTTNVAVTVPLTASAGVNVAVVVVTETGTVAVNTLAVTGTTVAKLASPVLNPASNVTSQGFTISWPAVTGADGYRVRLNGSTLFMPGNVTTYTFTGLPANTLATADVQALDSTNTKQASNYSATVSATTTAGAQVSGSYASQDYFSQDYNA